MNSLKNDKGEWVAQEGAPFSIARMKCQYPKLIDRLESLYCQEARIDMAIEAIREAGITGEFETLKIIDATSFVRDSMYGLVKAVTRSHK